MKIVTNLQATPSRAMALINLLAGRGWTPVSTLEAWMSPPSLRRWIKEDSDAAAQVPPAVANTIAALAEIGLVEQTGRSKKKLRLVQDPPLDLEGHRSAFAKTLLAPTVGAKRNDLALLIAWLLTLPVTDLPQGHLQFKTRLEEGGLKLDFSMQSDSRWDTLIYWLRFLGLSWQTTDTNCKGVVFDPTAFLRRHMESLVPPKEEVTIMDFRDRLGELCPVLDGGTVRRDLMASLKNPDERLSSALSFALLRLQAEGDLRVWCPDDQRPDAFLLMDNTRNTKVAFVARRED